MKKVFLVVVACLFVACGTNKKADKSNRGSNPGRGGDVGGTQIPGSPSQADSSGYWGQLIPQQGPIQEMTGTQSWDANVVVRYFLNTDWPFQVVGATTNQPDQTFQSNIFPQEPACTANTCQARVSMGIDNGTSHATLITSSNQTLSQMRQSSTQVPITGGAIRFAFWDSLTGQIVTDSTGTHALLGIPVWIPVLGDGSSYIRGSHAHLVFQDVPNDNNIILGNVTVDGDISGNNILGGTITFNNFYDFTGTYNQAQGTLGQFSINACAVFRCN